jgi:hypothetical protein
LLFLAFFPGGPFAHDACGNLTASGTKSFAYGTYNRLTALNGALLIAMAISGFTGLLTRDQQQPAPCEGWRKFLC